MIKKFLLFSLLYLTFPLSALADNNAEQLLKEVAATIKNTNSLNGNYEIRLRHLEPFEEIREEGRFDILRPNYLIIKGWNFLPSKTTGKWEKFSEANSYISDGSDYYTLFSRDNAVSYQKASAETGGQNITVKLSPIADFFDGNNSFFNQIAHARNKNILTSVNYLGEKVWEKSAYKVVEFITDKVEKNVAQHKVTQVYIGADNIAYRVLTTEKLGDLVSETETILKDISSSANLTSKNFIYSLPVNAKPYVVPLPPLEEGTQIPEITLINKSEKTFNLADYRGKTVILDFWATWCQPCLKSFPQTAKVLEKHGADKVVVVAINIWDNPVNASNWTNKHAELNSIIFARDIEAIAGKDSISLFHVATLPLQYVISPSGKVVTHFKGYLGSIEELDEAVKSAQKFQ